MLEKVSQPAIPVSDKPPTIDGPLSSGIGDPVSMGGVSTASSLSGVPLPTSGSGPSDPLPYHDGSRVLGGGS